jgi:predicted PurR-regulated permease PerM
VALLFVVLTGLGLVALLALPGIVADLAALARELPMALKRLVERVEPFLAAQGVPIPASGSEALGALQDDLRKLAPSAVGPLQTAIKTVLGGTASALGAVAGALMVPVVAFYLLHDFDDIVARMRELLPHGSRDAIVEMVGEVDTVLGQFVRGQLTVMLILAVLYAVGYSLAGVRLAVPIGIVAGLLSFIPYVGGALALGLALLMVALHYAGVGQLIFVVAVYGVIQVLEGFVITPRIVGDKLGLAPVWVLFALMVGGELFGFLGVMLALPAAAIVKVFVVRLLTRYQASALYTGQSATPDDTQDDSQDAEVRGGDVADAIAQAQLAPAGGPVELPRARLRLRPRRGVRRRARQR